MQRRLKSFVLRFSSTAANFSRGLVTTNAKDYANRNPGSQARVVNAPRIASGEQFSRVFVVKHEQLKPEK